LSGGLMIFLKRLLKKTLNWILKKSNGYAVYEGTELDVMKVPRQYVPFCIFKAYPIATEGQENDRIKALTGYSMETSNTGEKQLKTNPYDSHPNPG